MTEKNLKAGWRRVKFGDVVRQVKEKADPETSGLTRYVSGDHMETDDLRIRRWGEIGGGYLGPAFHIHFKPGQVLYGSRRTYLRKVAVADFEGICANTTFVLEPRNSEELRPGFLPFLMQTGAFNEFSVKNSKGSVNPYINFSDLAEFEFKLPPLEEQDRFVDVLAATEATRSAAVDLGHHSDRLLRSALTHLYSRGLRNERVIESPIGPIPKSWEVTQLGEQYDVQLGKMLYNELTKGHGQKPYLRNANIQWNRLDLSDVATMTFTDRDWNFFKLRPGDILACEGRHVGKAAIWQGELSEAGYQKALHRLRAKTEFQEPRFLLHCLRYYSISGKFKAVTGETTIPHLPAETFKRMYFPFPAKEEQIAIADVIDSIYSAITLNEQRIRESTELLRSLLDLE